MDDLKEHRTLTDADVEAIVSRLRIDMTKQFYADLGQGLWGAAKSAFIGALMVLAAWGAVKTGVDVR